MITSAASSSRSWALENSAAVVSNRAARVRGVGERGPLGLPGTLAFTDGPYVETKEYLGGLTIVDVADDAAARCGFLRSDRSFRFL